MKIGETFSKGDPNHADPTGNAAVHAAGYTRRIEMINEALNAIEEPLRPFIFEAVTKDRAYTYFETHGELPCSRDHYYDCYREFFFVLDKIRE